MKIVIYDCEIKKGIAKRGENKIPGIEYCKGWGDHAEMGVSVTGVYVYDEDRYRVFCDDNVDEMLSLFAAADLLVGFNSLRFDDALLAATYEDFVDVTTPRYDILVEIWRAAGLKPSWGSPKTHGGFGLGDMCETNFDVPKSGHGAMAPVDWQRGKIGSVIDYCLHDIYMTKMLMDLAISGTPVVNPKGGLLNLLVPDGVEIRRELPEPPDPDGDIYDRDPPGEVDLEVLQREEASKKMGVRNVEHRYHWDNLAVELEWLPKEDKYMAAVHDSEGLIVSRKLMLHEWSAADMSGALLRKDGPALVKYLEEHEKLYRDIGDESGNA